MITIFGIEPNKVNRVVLVGLTTTLSSPVFFLIRFTSKINCNLTFTALFANLDDDCDNLVFDLEEVQAASVDLVNGKVHFDLLDTWTGEIWAQNSSSNLDPLNADEKLGDRKFVVQSCCDSVSSALAFDIVSVEIVGNGSTLTQVDPVGITSINLVNPNLLDIFHKRIPGAAISIQGNTVDHDFGIFDRTDTMIRLEAFSDTFVTQSFLFFKIGKV